MKNNIMKFLSVMILILGSVMVSFAQPLPTTPSANGNPYDPGTPVVQCPVGSGYWILLALALGYAAYRTWQVRKAEKTA